VQEKEKEKERKEKDPIPLSALYVYKGKAKRGIPSLLCRRKTKGKNGNGLCMLQKILSMCISLDTPILDPLCVLRIKRKQEKRYSLSYIPIEAKEKDTDKY